MARRLRSGLRNRPMKVVSSDSEDAEEDEQPTRSNRPTATSCDQTDNGEPSFTSSSPLTSLADCESSRAEDSKSSLPVVLKFSSSTNESSNNTNDVRSLNNELVNEANHELREDKIDTELDRPAKSAESLLHSNEPLTHASPATSQRSDLVYNPVERSSSNGEKVNYNSSLRKFNTVASNMNTTSALPLATTLLPPGLVPFVPFPPQNFQPPTFPGPQASSLLPSQSNQVANNGTQETHLTNDAGNNTLTSEHLQTEFEDVTAKQRADSRINNEGNLESESVHKPSLAAARECAPHEIEGEIANTTPSRISNEASPKIGQTEHDSTVTDNEPSDAASDATHEVEKPTLADLIIENAWSSKKRGDVAIIFDADDLGKTLLLPSALLERRTNLLPSRDAEGKLKYVLILKVDGDVSKMPVLNSLGPDWPAEKARLDTSTAAASSNMASELTSIALHIEREVLLTTIQISGKTYFRALEADKKVKHEPDEHISMQNASDEVHAAQTPSTRVDWVKAWYAFLLIASSDMAPPIRTLVKQLGEDARSAVFQIEGLIQIAKNYNGSPSVITSLKLMMNSYIGNSTLFPAIAAEAPSWLLIGCDIQEETVFREALCHVVGCYPMWQWSKSIEDIPKELMQMIDSKARDLVPKEQEVQIQLSSLMLKAKQNPKSEADLASPMNNPDKYDIVNFWFHWVRGHLDYLKSYDRGCEQPDVWYCDHGEDYCASRAGLYRAIRQGGDAYLREEEVAKKLAKTRYGGTRQQIHDALGEIKKRAAEIVAPIVGSSLQHREEQQLDYLTSVVVADEEIPWKQGTQSNGDESDDENDMFH